MDVSLANYNLIYPTIDHNELEHLVPAKLVRRMLSSYETNDISFLSDGWYQNDVVIEAIASKYNSRTQNNFCCFGCSNCREDNGILNRIFEQLSGDSINRNFCVEDVIGVWSHNGGTEKNDITECIVLTRYRIYIRNGTQSYEECEYKDTFFFDNKVVCSRIKHNNEDDLDSNIVDFSVDNDFIDFAAEYRMLYCSDLSKSECYHPIADLDRGTKERYVDFLMGLAKTSTDSFSSVVMLRLAFMCKEFHLGARYLVKSLRETSFDSEKFDCVLPYEVSSDLRYVFVHDIFIVTAGNLPEILQKRIERETFVGKSFSDVYAEYMMKHVKDDKFLFKAMVKIANLVRCKDIRLCKFYQIQEFDKILDFELMKTGVNENG